MRESIKSLLEQIRHQPHLSQEEKQELLDLVGDIESEVGEGDFGDETKAQPLKDALRMTVEEAEKKSVSDQLSDSLLNLEATFPKTAAALGQIGNALARMGI